MGDDNVARVKAAADAFNRGDLEGYLTLYDEGATLHGYSPAPIDKPSARAFYRGILDAFPGATLRFHEVIGAGDRLAIRFELSGTHGGPFMGVPATGRPVSLPGITILHMRAGRCVERWSTADMLSVLVQVGAVPARA
jgi:hypothetical protein